jgi:hypothetical protein
MRGDNVPHGLQTLSGDGFALAIFRNEKVLDRLATSEKTTIVVERAPGGKMRDPPIEPHDPYGPGTGVRVGNVIWPTM